MISRTDADSSAARSGTLLWIALPAILLALTVVVVRVGWLQIKGDPRLAYHGAGKGVTLVRDAPRGDLLDRRGRALATSRFVYQPIADPELIPRPADTWIMRVSESLDTPPEEIGVPVAEALAHNDALRRSGTDDDSGPARPSTTWRERAQTIIDTFMARVNAGQATPLQAIREDLSVHSPRRYLPIGNAVDQATATSIKEHRIPGLFFERRAARTTIESEDVYGLAPLIGKVGVDENGRLGAERFLHSRLEGEPSRVRLVRDARGRSLWMQRGENESGERGEDIRLSVDIVIQRIAWEELWRGVRDADAAGGRIVVTDPRSGELLAMLDVVRDVHAEAYAWPDKEAPVTPGERLWAEEASSGHRFQTILQSPKGSEPALRRQRCLTDAYEPGSTFKSFIWASGYDMGLMPEHETLTTTNPYRTPYGRLLADVTRKTGHTWDQVLERSSNIGMAILSERMSFGELHEIVDRFHFGERTGIGLRNESPGLVTPLSRWGNYSQTSVAIGQEVAVTPLQMVQAFACFAQPRGSEGVMPRLSMLARRPGYDGADLVERVISAEAASRARGVMVRIVESMDAKMKRRFPGDPEPRYVLFGKSGTAEIPLIPPPGKRRPRGARGYYTDQYNSSFIAGGPYEDPRLIVLCVIDDPGPGRVRQREYYGSDVAGPVVRRVFERVLPYLGVEPSPGTDDAETGERPATIASRAPTRTMSETNER